jgi:holo-[acyl-carrier protein] synthase
MIRGLGIDVVEVDRIRALAVKHGERFLGRVFTLAEAGYCSGKSDPAPHLSARFAAKEAAAKALGTGLARGVRFRDIEVVADGGPPRLVLHGKAGELARGLGVTRIHLSLTHEHGTAAAVVVLEGVE